MGEKCGREEFGFVRYAEKKRQEGAGGRREAVGVGGKGRKC